MPGEIEFLDSEPEPGDDEYLPVPGRHRRLRPARRGRTDRAGRTGRPSRPSRPGRTGRLVGAGFVAVIAGLLVARGLTTGDGPPVASPSRSLPTTGSATSPTAAAPSLNVVTLDPSTGRAVDAARQSCLPSDQIGRTITVASLPALISGSRGEVRAGSTAPGDASCMAIAPAQCPEADDGQIACLVTRRVPPAVLRAVHLRYPVARVVFAYTEVARQTQLVWYRMIRLSIGDGSTLVITVEQSGNDPGRSVVVDNSVTQQVRAVDAGSRVNTVIDVVAPSAQLVDFELPSDLVSDARLAAPG